MMIGVDVDVCCMYDEECVYVSVVLLMKFVVVKGFVLNMCVLGEIYVNECLCEFVLDELCVYCDED